MAKLLSHHDRYHSHAILGLLALLHFAYRFYQILIEGRETFSTSYWSAASLLIHVFLHVLSFQFELPRNRIWTKPMIWREFRVHNAIFAYRHLVGSALGILAPQWWWQQPTLSSLVAKVVLVLASAKAADFTTEMIGSKETRTTNAMPYPKATPPEVEEVAKRFYAKSQFAATSIAAFGTPSLSFCSVLAIELASLLMTLVRKGLIEGRTYHIVYASSLFIMFPCIGATLHCGDAVMEMAAFRGLVVCALAVDLRLTRRLDKYMVWGVAIVAGHLLAELLANVAYYKLLFAWPGMVWSAVDTLARMLPDSSEKKKEDIVDSNQGGDGENVSNVGISDSPAGRS
eukprot:symbB.v1.2.039800.t1/scaffold6792.1/size15526/3